MPGSPRPDFGAVVLRHDLPQEDRVGRGWVAIFVFGSVFMLGAALFFDPRPGPPRPVYYLLWLAFVAAAARSIAARYFSTPSVVLERGLFLPAYLPRHWLFLRARAVPFAELKRVELDNTPFRAGSHLFETARGPRRCAKAYFPPAKRLAEEIKRLAPEVQVALVDRKGRHKLYAPVVSRRLRKEQPKGEQADAK